ncbi:13158_t:CDS:2 [Dentiscutata heterogama]|uniref:13158_t:CDS:1 n=1 Tax=Dentiscutata heterogama TaxID=1316150 RepID=A0ACA9KL10_9GLOM|nr:13158_t:CDS:2 [Dentiscutata heterogama]
MVEENRKQTPEEATADEKELNKMGVTIMNAEEEECDEDKDYQELLEQLALESGHRQTWMSVEPPKWGEPDGGVDYSDDDEWDNENIETYEVFMIKVENGDSGEETIKSELEDYSPAFRFFNNRVPDLGLFTSPFSNPGKKALESDDESTQSRVVVTPSETGSENCKENTNLETDKEGDNEFWYSHDDDETVITQKKEDRCHEISKEKEVFMIKMKNEDEQKEGIEVENIVPGPSERTLNEINGQAWTQSMTPLYFQKMTSDCHSALSFLHLN